jgi:superfamily II DNA or RNA helicase
MELHFDHGTLVAPSLPDGDPALSTMFVFDDRTGVYRAPASRYRDIVLHLHRSGLAYDDRARAFEPVPLALHGAAAPFPYQQAALDAWLPEKRGVVVLPTGAGKTYLAMLAMARVGRPTLIVVPTLNLLYQWRQELAGKFGITIGLLGGGHHDRQVVTVTTYDSAALHTEFHGRRFGLLVFDECHHLPSPSYRFIAEGSIAPYRLGLTATPERTDGGEKLLFDLVGPLRYVVGIDALEGKYLADYEIERIDVPLSDEDQRRYDEARSIYLGFLRSERIAVGSPDGWSQFIMRSQRTEAGRRAFAAYHEQKRIALTSRAKLDVLWEIVVRHRRDRVIVFTRDNETVYRLSRWLLAPVITHHTPAAERVATLDAFARGDWPILLTSNVLNEGVDVPEANVGVVLSGSGSVREHVQRLGRILRRRPDKRAVLYEICSAGTAEDGISERRRQHAAYQKGEAKAVGE